MCAFLHYQLYTVMGGLHISILQSIPKSLIESQTFIRNFSINNYCKVITGEKNNIKVNLSRYPLPSHYFQEYPWYSQKYPFPSGYFQISKTPDFSVVKIPICNFHQYGLYNFKQGWWGFQPFQGKWKIFQQCSQKDPSIFKIPDITLIFQNLETTSL